MCLFFVVVDLLAEGQQRQQACQQDHRLQSGGDEEAGGADVHDIGPHEGEEHAGGRHARRAAQQIRGKRRLRRAEIGADDVECLSEKCRPFDLPQCTDLFYRGKERGNFP